MISASITAAALSIYGEYSQNNTTIPKLELTVENNYDRVFEKLENNVESLINIAFRRNCSGGYVFVWLNIHI